MLSVWEMFCLRDLRDTTGMEGFFKGLLGRVGGLFSESVVDVFEIPSLQYWFSYFNFRYTPYSIEEWFVNSM